MTEPRPAKTGTDRATGPGTNQAWFERAGRVIPGGVDSPVRSFASVGGTPVTVARGEGPWLFDVEGRRYLDLVQSYGALLLGHADAGVLAALGRAAAAGTTFGMPTPGETELAEAVCARVPGCEQVRFVSSGTEAAMSAIRLARGCTGRSVIVKFDGNYHGHSDELLAGGGSGVATLGLPASAGVTPGAVADTLVVPYNEVPALDRGVAAVIVEPVAANMSLVAPRPRFLPGLRDACDRAGALLIFDEVITGFRLGPGGATERYGITPDLWCFGKVLGGGMPLAAFGGRRDLMSGLAPAGSVYQAGTLSGNPLATAAGLAVLARVTGADYADLARRAGSFGADLEKAIRHGGLEARVPVEGTLLGILVAPPGTSIPAAPENYGQVAAIAGNGVYPELFHALLRRGVMIAPGAYEVMFPGLAHTEEELGFVVEAAGQAAAEVAASY